LSATRGREEQIMPEMQHDHGPAGTPAEFAERNASSGDSQGAGVMDRLSDVAESLKDKTKEVAEEQKTEGARRIHAFGQAVHGAADELGKEIPSAASYVHSAAEQIEGASARLRASSISDLTSRLERFAREQPAATFAGCVMAGFVLSRFLKSSS
jgi:hypothetical protein